MPTDLIHLSLRAPPIDDFSKTIKPSSQAPGDFDDVLDVLGHTHPGSTLDVRRPPALSQDLELRRWIRQLGLEPGESETSSRFSDSVTTIPSPLVDSEKLESQIEEKSPKRLGNNALERNMAVVSSLFANQALVGNAVVGSASDDQDNQRRMNQVSGVAAGVGVLASILPSIRALKDARHVVESSLKLYEEFSKSEILSPPPQTQTPLRDMIESDQYGVGQKVLSAITFAVEKIGSRARRYKVKATGQVVTAAGVGVGVAAGVLGGIGALPGGILAAAGSGVSVLPETYAAVRSVYKNLKETKGVDRRAAAELFWALVLRKAKREGKSGVLSPVATALMAKLDKNKADFDTETSVQTAENLAVEFLKITKVFDYLEPGENGTLTFERFKLIGEEGSPDSGGFQRIMHALRSTTT